MYTDFALKVAEYFDALQQSRELTEVENSIREQAIACKDIYPVSCVTADDLETVCIKTEGVTRQQMKRLARKMGDDYNTQLFWFHLPMIAGNCDMEAYNQVNFIPVQIEGEKFRIFEVNVDGQIRQVAEKALDERINAAIRDKSFGSLKGSIEDNPCTAEEIAGLYTFFYPGEDRDPTDEELQQAVRDAIAVVG